MPPDDAITDIQVVSPLAMARTGESVSLFIQDLGNISPIWAKRTATIENVTDAGGTLRTAYAWRKQQMGPGGVWQDSDDLVSGFTSESNPRQEPLFSAQANRSLPLGEVVRIYPGVRDTEPDPALNHGLEWWFTGGPLERAMLKIEPYNYEARIGDTGSAYGYKARLQRWKLTTPFSISTYPDNSQWEDVPGPVYVRVRDPNGAAFQPGGYVWATFVETLPQTGEDLYERTGLGEFTVSGNTVGPYYENDSSPFPAGLSNNDLLHGVSYFAPGETFNFGSVRAGGAILYQAPSTRITGGRIASGNPYGGVGVVGGGPGGSYVSGTPGTPYQWVRGGFSGFDRLGTGRIDFGDTSVEFGRVPNGLMNGGDYLNWLGTGPAGFVSGNGNSLILGAGPTTITIGGEFVSNGPAGEIQIGKPFSGGMLRKVGINGLEIHLGLGAFPSNVFVHGNINTGPPVFVSGGLTPILPKFRSDDYQWILSGGTDCVAYSFGTMWIEARGKLTIKGNPLSLAGLLISLDGVGSATGFPEVSGVLGPASGGTGIGTIPPAGGFLQSTGNGYITSPNIRGFGIGGPGTGGIPGMGGIEVKIGQNRWLSQRIGNG